MDGELRGDPQVEARTASRTSLKSRSAERSPVRMRAGTPVSMRTILDTLISFASVPVEVETESSRLRPGEVKRAFGSAEKLCSIARWEREYPLERTLADLLDDRRAAVGASASDIRK